MARIRPELSQKNRYWIDKHRHYELKHFCLQYPIWKHAYATLSEDSLSLSRIEKGSSGTLPGDPTATRAIKRAYYHERIKLIEKTAMATDSMLHEYILRAVTEGLSYTCLKSTMDIPCSRDMYYDRYRRFFWLLNESRN